MKCVLVLNGEFSNDYVFADNLFVIACDGAYKELKKRQIKADLVLGDFDSLGYIPQGAEVFPAEKDMTDGEIGLYKAAELGFKEVDVICFGGKREDHFLGNLSLLIKAAETGLKATAYTNNSVIRYLVKGVHEYDFAPMTTVSLFSFCGCYVRSSEGLKYPYNKVRLDNDNTLGISNVALSGKVKIEIVEGGAFLIENKKFVD